ncbi:hypothetical protein O6H91_11G069800 [Diphasiastrum complanatum]|uniref:Uncharacterized protein n=1 Tax=Diphasiastrum complanatum TaxID=34168 RepID=A0ACC2CAE7_DIPCM|nr:hypothetical protein O6H91_11G069800 [Diphasiastrum complanatum]
MASTSEVKRDAVAWVGQDEAFKKAIQLLQAFNLPGGILPLQNVIEVGFVRATGYMWILLKNNIEHEFQTIGKVLSYSTEISGYLERNRIKNLTGVKAKELLYKAPVLEISVEGSKITFKSNGGLSKTFPIEAFR